MQTQPFALGCAANMLGHAGNRALHPPGLQYRDRHETLTR